VSTDNKNIVSCTSSILHITLPLVELLKFRDVLLFHCEE
jgi:hypothetical protein